MEKAIVLLSGGMDSAVCAAIAKSDGYDIAALHLNYNHRTEKKEHECFLSLVKHFNIKQSLTVDIDYLKLIGGSSLTDNNIPVEMANPGRKEIPNSYVPFRNGNFLAIAASWAEVINASAIYIGAMQLDSSGYPDCRRDFLDEMEKAINLGTQFSSSPNNYLKVISPIINLTKAEIVKEGTILNIPFRYTWSCYSENDKACGICDSCALRLRGFREAGLEDPIEYQTRPIYI